MVPLLAYFEAKGEDVRILLTPDHPTPVYARTHTNDAIPFVLYDSTEEKDSGITCYCEQSGFDGGICLPKGEDLIELLIGRSV